MSQTISRPDRKAKKSFTLSVESVAFLEELRKKNRAESISATLEDLLQAMQREEKRTSIEREMTAYYDSLTDEEVAEEKKWGEFARRSFPLEGQS